MGDAQLPRDAGAPVVADHVEGVETGGIGECQHVAGERVEPVGRALRRPGAGRVPALRGHQDAQTSSREQRHHVVPRGGPVGEAVEEHDRLTVERALVAHVERQPVVLVAREPGRRGVVWCVRHAPSQSRGSRVGAPARLGPRAMAGIVGCSSLPPWPGAGHDRRMPRRSAPRGRPAPTPARRVVIVVFDGLQSLDLTGPLEVFDGAGRHPAARARGRLRRHRRGARPPVRCARRAASRSRPTPPLAEVRGPIDTLVVVGGDGVLRRRATTRARRARSRRRRAAQPPRRPRCAPARSCSPRPVCSTGAGPPPTGPRCATLARALPRTSTVDPDPIFVRDGNVWTSAGVTAGMDLALALVEDDLGRDVALDVARQLVMFVQRPGGQSQFSAQLGAQPAERDDRCASCRRGSPTIPTPTCSVDRARRRASAMSPRHFARVSATRSA